eukprot:311158_1
MAMRIHYELMRLCFALFMCIGFVNGQTNDCDGTADDQHICNECNPTCMVCQPPYLTEADCDNCGTCQYVWWFWLIMAIMILCSIISIIICIARCCFDILCCCCDDDKRR